MSSNLSLYEIECLEKAKQLIEADLSRHTSIDELAQKVALGKTKLKEGFKHQYGFPIYTFLKQQRMKLALELITDTEKTIKQIAHLTGFRYSNNFITAFSKHYGISPGLARKNKRQLKSL